MFVVGYTGFCVKPLRDSNVMTIPELFERRYGKLVRWLSGVVVVLGGLLNMGVFLRVGGQFLVVCCGLNLRYLELAMTVLLIGIAVYTILGAADPGGARVVFNHHGVRRHPRRVRHPAHAAPAEGRPGSV